MNDNIDFVIPWVDGSDIDWLKEKNKYSENKTNIDNRDIRYRDWGLLKYWFRGVEKFAPWVNNVFFVTYGHLPKWLNTNNPKLKIVNHWDFIPHEYLPTFSSIPIELNFHRIKGLSEQFVYFNDDVFLINSVKKEEFFKNGVPRDLAVINRPFPNDKTYDSNVNSVLFELNHNFNKKNVIKNNLTKWLNINYGNLNFRTLLGLPWPKFIGLYYEHTSNNFLKSTYEKVWKIEYENLNETCLHKFRQPNDINQYIFKDWQRMEGNFIPRKKIGRSIVISENYKLARKIIENQEFKEIALNDGDFDPSKFDEYKKGLIESFEKILPDKSSFEK